MDIVSLLNNRKPTSISITFENLENVVIPISCIKYLCLNDIVANIFISEGENIISKYTSSETTIVFDIKKLSDIDYHSYYKNQNLIERLCQQDIAYIDVSTEKDTFEFELSWDKSENNPNKNHYQKYKTSYLGDLLKIVVSKNIDEIEDFAY